MTFSTPGAARVAALIILPAAAAPAQTRGFVVRLGVDTIAVERLTRVGDTVTGAVARRTPAATVLRYAVVFNRDSSIASYREGIYRPDGSPIQTGMVMTFSRDSVVREVIQNGQPVTRRDAISGVTLPAIGGTSPYWQELAIQAVRRSHATAFSFFNFALQAPPSGFDVKLVGPDSAELLFAQGFRRGYRMNRAGELVHGDATNTTVRLQMTPVRDADIDEIARGWGAKESMGQGMPVPSPRDSLSATIGMANVSIDYGSPSKRGRQIWGALVPFDTVWRLGANLPTQLRTDRALDIGGVQVPAGAYTLWLVPSRTKPLLLVNRQTTGWVGVPMHDASQDIASIPVTAHVGAPAGGERLHLMIQDGRLLMLWDDAGYEVAIHPGESSSGRYPCRAVHTFDYWEGTFESHPWDQPASPSRGTLVNTREYEGCVFIERWTGAAGGNGMSMVFYDTARRKWRMIWNSDSNSSNDFEGDYVDGAMRFEGVGVDNNGKKILARNVLQNVSPDLIRHIYSESNDDGKTWVVRSDGRFVRIKR